MTRIRDFAPLRRSEYRCTEGGMQINVFEITDPGLVRDENQDAFGHFETEFGRLAVVCDGMGGHQGGRIASHTAVETVGETVDGAFESAPDLLRRCCERANSAVHERAERESLHGMGTTIVACLVARSGDTASIAHVGDSRAYLVRKGQIRQLTKDHTVVQRLIDQGRIDERQALTHPQAGVISRTLGVNADVEVEIGEPVGLSDGDQVLLCSDGLTTMVDDDDIARYIARFDGADALQELVALAKARGGYDNITIQLVQIGDPPSVALDETELERLQRLRVESGTLAVVAPPTSRTTRLALFGVAIVVAIAVAVAMASVL